MGDQKILVTGGCGFIGTALIAQLRRLNPQVQIVVLDSLVEGTVQALESVAPVERQEAHKLELSPNRVVLVEGDVRDPKTVKDSASGVNAVVHLAANTGVGQSVSNPRLDMEVNVDGTFNVLEAARTKGIPRVVFASSGAPAGEVEPPIHEEIAPHPVSPYGASKLAGEGYCSAYFKTFNIDTVILRFGNVYGPGSNHKGSVVAKFIRQALNAEPCVIFGSGQQTRDFVYVDDLVDAIMCSLESPVGGETFQIATGVERTLEEMADILRATLAEHGVELNLIHDAPRIGDVMRNFADVSKAKSQLGWQSKTELKDGLDQTVRWFLRQREGK